MVLGSLEVFNGRKNRTAALDGASTVQTGEACRAAHIKIYRFETLHDFQNVSSVNYVGCKSALPEVVRTGP